MRSEAADCSLANTEAVAAQIEAKRSPQKEEQKFCPVPKTVPKVCPKRPAGPAPPKAPSGPIRKPSGPKKLQALSPIKKAAPPKTKQLSWQKVEHVDENTVWAQMTQNTESVVSFDEVQIEQMFANKIQRAGGKAEEDETSSSSKKKDPKRSLTTPQRAMAMSIGLNRIRKNLCSGSSASGGPNHLSRLKDAILKLDESVLG